MGELNHEVASLLGAERVRPASDREAAVASIVVEPHTETELAALVAKCERDRVSLAPVGAARTLAIIRKKPVDLAVSFARMNRLVAYDPDDMTLVCEAGMTHVSYTYLTLPTIDSV